MKFSNIFLLTILICCACSSKNDKSFNKKQTIDSLNNVIISELHDSISPTKIGGEKVLSFKFNTDSSGYILTTINIYSDGILYQKINTNKDIENKKFQLIDWNFDGFKDITVLNNCGSGGCAYWIWNYSLEEEKYIYNTLLSEVLGLEIDIPNKFIVFHYRAGYEAEIWDTMKYKNDKLIFVKGLYRERWNDTLGNFWVKNTYKKIVNNAKIIKIDSFISKE